MKNNKEYIEITFFARGGQGAKAAAEIIAQAAVGEGKFVQAFPQFGPERSGAPTKTFVRISNTEIRTHEPVVDSDVIVMLDETILDSEAIIDSVGAEKILIINTKTSKEEVVQKLTAHGAKFEGNIFPIDANGISMEIVGQPRPNTVILGKFVQATQAVQLESVIKEFRNIFEHKIGEEGTNKNILAIEKAYDTN